MGHLLLVTGGTRSGKSRYAVDRARTWGARVLYVATCQAADEEMRQRIQRHQAERPATWMTLETTPDLLHTIRDLGTRADGILLDCLTLYVSGLLMAGSSELHVMQQVEALCLTLGQGRRPAAIVTNEVGCGVVPETALGRRFRDAAGGANQVAARHAQEVVLMISGIPVVIKGADIPSL